MDIPLQPAENIRRRVGIMLLLLLPLLFSSGGLLFKMFLTTVLAFLIGSHRRAAFREGHFERQMVIAFVPLRRQRWNLKRFVQIEIETEERAGWGVFLLLGAYSWVVFRVVDFILSWLGGIYCLSLRSAKGKSVLVWQGNSDDLFQENLSLLKNATGLPVERKGL